MNAAYTYPLDLDTLNAAYVGTTAIANAATYGNDATDATAHFQTLMSKLSTAGGGELFIPRGTYRISAPLAVPSNVTVRGEGRMSVIKATFTGSGVIYNAGALATPITGDTSITVTALTVDGNGTANQGVVFAGVQRGTIHDVRVKSCTGYGLWLWSAGEGVGGSQGTPSEQCTISACHITDVVDTGIEIDAAIRCMVIGNTIEGSNGRGLYAWNGATDNVFQGNVVVGTGTTGLVAMQVSGITGGQSYPQQTARNAFVGNTASGVIQRGIKVTGTSGNAPLASTFTDNICTTTLSTGSGVELDYATRVRIASNSFDSFDTPLRISMPSSGGTPGSVRDVALIGNTFQGGNTSSIYSLASAKIDGNLWTNCANHCVQFYSCTGMTLSGNSFVDAGASANATAMVFNDYNSAPCSGNVVVGNRTVDTRATKYLGNVLTMGGTADYNICTGNSAKGAKSGAQAVQNATTGPTVNNVIANNINA